MGKPSVEQRAGTEQEPEQERAATGPTNRPRNVPGFRAVNDPSGGRSANRPADGGNAEASVTAYLGLGSSLGDRLAHLHAALRFLQVTDVLDIAAVSPCYESPHLGLQAGDAERYPAHLNCVAKIKTRLAPLALLERVREAEAAGQRQRRERWGPRTIDIDILLYGEQTIDTPELTVPHPGLTARAFVVLPLRDVAPDLILPAGEPIRTVAELDTIRVQRIERVAAHELLF